VRDLNLCHDVEGSAAGQGHPQLGERFERTSSRLVGRRTPFAYRLELAGGPDEERK